MEEVYKIHVDGGSRGNPGYSACAFCVEKNGRLVFEKSFFLGVCTNNQAEYMGVINSLSWLLDFDEKLPAIIYLDSELVERQLTGRYKIKDEVLKKLFLVAKNLEGKLGVNVNYKSIPRSENKTPDKLLNDLLNHMTT